MDEFLNENLIELDVCVKNREDAVRRAGELLKKNEMVTSEYIDCMIKYLDEFGPYIVITNSVAMPHARPEDGALKSGLCLVILKNPINFGSTLNDPVKFVFGLSAVDGDKHIHIISKLASLLEDDRFLLLLQKATRKNEILEYIRRI